MQLEHDNQHCKSISIRRMEIISLVEALLNLGLLCRYTGMLPRISQSIYMDKNVSNWRGDEFNVGSLSFW